MRPLPVSHELPAADAEPAVLVGVDGSDGSLWALERALQEAQVHGLPLRVLAAVNPTPAVATAGLEDVIKDSVDRLLVGMTDVVQRGVAAASVHVPGVTVTPTLHIVAGDPVALLLGASARQHTLVVGARGNGGFSRLLVGSVASAMVYHALCPVLLVPGPKR